MTNQPASPEIFIELASGDGRMQARLNATSWFEKASEASLIEFVKQANGNRTEGASVIEAQDIAYTFAKSDVDVREIFDVSHGNEPFSCELEDEEIALDYAMRKYPDAYMEKVLKDNLSARAIREGFGEYLTDCMAGDETLAWCIMREKGLGEMYAEFEDVNGVGPCEAHEFDDDHHLESLIRKEAASWELLHGRNRSPKP
jgi:hypothetical protein